MTSQRDCARCLLGTLLVPWAARAHDDTERIRAAVANRSFPIPARVEAAWALLEQLAPDAN